MTKKTSANNDFLKKVKKDWNEKIYSKAVKIINKEGEEKAREFVQQFTTKKLSY